MKDFIQRSCGNKSRYSTPEKAGMYAARCKESRTVDLRIYFCPFCGGYHLTSVTDVLSIQVPEYETKTHFSPKTEKSVRCKSGHLISEKLVDKCPVCLENQEKKKLKQAERAEKLSNDRTQKELEEYRIWAENRIKNEDRGI